MILLIPQNRVCQGKTTKYPVTDINPVLWIKSGDPGYTVANVDGFVVTKDNKVSGIFKKFEYIEEVANEEISAEAISDIFPVSEIQLLTDFSKIMGCVFFTFIWPENFPVGFDLSSKLIHSYTFDFSDNKLAIKTHKLITIGELESGIKTLRKRSFTKGKGINAASSNVECYLANNTDNPWPGDIDAIIYDKAKARYTAIIEFKTHNGDSPIAGEHIGKYGDQDWRRFNVLFDLTDNFEKKAGYRPLLFFIVWGTNPEIENHLKIKIDLIERGKVIKSYLLPRPKYNQFSDELFRLILKEANEITV